MRSVMDCIGKPHNHLNGNLADVCGLLSVTLIVAIDGCIYYITRLNSQLLHGIEFISLHINEFFKETTQPLANLICIKNPDRAAVIHCFKLLRHLHA